MASSEQLLNFFNLAQEGIVATFGSSGRTSLEASLFDNAGGLPWVLLRALLLTSLRSITFEWGLLLDYEETSATQMNFLSLFPTSQDHRSRSGWRLPPMFSTKRAGVLDHEKTVERQQNAIADN